MSALQIDNAGHQSYTNRQGDTYQLGDYYEDCSYRPMKLVFIDGDDFEGQSLVDGGSLGSCSAEHCGLVKLTQEEAFDLYENGPADSQVREWYIQHQPERMWWE